MAGPGEDWDAQKMLDCYIYDYMKRKNMHGVAEIFSQEANVNDMPPVVEGFLTDWWSILWETYCARMRLNSGAVGESSSSSVQPNNVLGNSHQIIYQDVPLPLPDHQPGPQVPPGADLDTMRMGNQPPPHVLAANNYQEEHHPYLLQAEADAHAVAHASSSSDTSSQQLQALLMSPQTQQEVPHNVPQQGVSLGRSMTPGGAPYGALPRANQQNSEAGKNKAVMLPSPPRALSLNVQQENEYYKDGKEDEETSMYNRFNHLEISQESDGQADGDEEEGASERPKLPEGFYEIEAVRKKRTCKGVTQYLIKWLGWPESANTWEPLENLQLCSDVIEEFEASLQSGKGKSGQKRKSKSKRKRKQKH